MKKYLVILMFSGILISCAHCKYFVEKEDTLSQIDWKQNVVNYIPLTNDDLHSDVLRTTYLLLKSKQYLQLDYYLSTVQDSSDYCLAKTFYCISKSKYEDALYFLNKINESHVLLKKLISIDLNYELTKLRGEYNNYTKLLRDYQNLADEYPDNDILKKIIAIRTRYIRHNF
jgi:hypothetical protein